MSAPAQPAALPEPPAAADPPDRGAARGVAAAPPPAGLEGLRLHFCDSRDGFAQLRPGWEALAARDPRAALWHDWRWLEAPLAANPGRWQIVSVQDAARGGAPVALLPLRREAVWNAEAGRLETVLDGAGRLILSESAGLLCDPERAEVALPALARALTAQRWARLTLRVPGAAGPLGRLAAALRRAGCAARLTTGPGTAESAPRRRLPLPDRFETWLETGPEAETRARLRRLLRRLAPGGGWRVTLTRAESFERDCAILLAQRRAEIAAARGEATAAAFEKGQRALLGNALRCDALMLSVLWDGARPLGAVAHLIDLRAGRIRAVQGGRAAPEAGAGVGTLLHADAIRRAIADGFDSYDFAPGPAAARAGFGGRLLGATVLEVARPGVDALDRRDAAAALRRAQTLLQDGDAAAAETALAQIERLLR
ncbi:GNAT family N-acetyltransferase [Roseivivax sp. CAU 1761]